MAYFTGYTEIEENDDRSRGEESDLDSDSEDGQEDFDFVQKPSRQLRQIVQTMRELQFKNDRFVVKEKTRVRGKFDPLFSFPWWMTEVKINTTRKLSNNEKWASQLPSYSFRTDADVGEKILSLFLVNGCKVHWQHAWKLLNFIKLNNLRPTLKDLIENLQRFGDSSEDNCAIGEQIRSSLCNSPTGKAFSVPEFLKFAHRLFPNRVCSIFDECNLSTLESLNEAIKTEPWVFGYWTVLTKWFGLKGCEAKLTSFTECKLLWEMPIVMQDALHIYNSLCRMSRKFGHTYVHLWQLKSEQPNIRNWEESLAYLSTIDAVKTSKDHQGNRWIVFLPYLRGYEKNIARNLSEMMTKSPWISDVEIDEEVFEGDEDQINAAHLIVQKPLVVMSGRGGSGKTFVVSSVLSKVLDMKRQEVLQEFADVEKDEEMGLTDAGEDEGHVHPFSNLEADQENDGDTHTAEQEVQKEAACSNCHKDIQRKEKLKRNQIETKMKKIENEVLLTAPTGKAASILGKRTKLPSHTLHAVIYSCLYWEQSGHGDWKFSKVRLLVCDECSLISVRLFSKLVSYLTRYSQLQQIILLGDIDQLPSIEPGNFLNDVYTSLEAHGVAVRLRTNHRSESDFIVKNAIRISMQQMPVFDTSSFLSVPYHVKRNDSDSETNIVTRVVKNLLKREELRDHSTFQFVAFRRKDCEIINELCAIHFNDHSIKDGCRKPDYRVGDKVCIRRNSECFDAYQKKSVRLCNGEIFFITDIIEEQDNHGKKKVYFSLDNGSRVMKISLQQLRAAKLAHAWARTIHTFQGSEIGTVVYAVGRPHYQNWQHVYTAVTRGVKQVIIVNNPSHLQQAISTSPVQRQTKLMEDLANELEYGKLFCFDADDDGFLDEVHFAVNSEECKSSENTDHHCGEAELALSSSLAENNGFAQSHSSVEDPFACTSDRRTWEPLDDFHISRENLKSKRMKQDLGEKGGSAASSMNGVTVPQSCENLLHSATSHFRSPGFKRKYPGSENVADYLTPPQTPPSLKNLPSSLGVSPLNQKLSPAQEAVVPPQSATTPVRPIPAQFRSWCRLCKKSVNVGDEITYIYDGSEKSWIHGKCKPSKQ